MEFINTLSKNNYLDDFDQLKEGNKEIQKIYFLPDPIMNKNNSNSLWIDIPICYANIIKDIFVFYPNGNYSSMAQYYITTNFNQLISFTEFSLYKITKVSTDETKNL